jgi:hypothetical protein
MAFHRSIFLDAFGIAGAETNFNERPLADVDGWDVLDRDSDALTMDSRIADAYNEDAFRYFLEIERQRAEASGRPFLLLLIDFGKQSRRAPIDAEIADRLFEALESCLRDTDFVGWYRQGQIAGGVLTQDSAAVASDTLTCVTERVRVALAANLPGAALDRAQVRAYQMPAPAKLITHRLIHVSSDREPCESRRSVGPS